MLHEIILLNVKVGLLAKSQFCRNTEPCVFEMQYNSIKYITTRQLRVSVLFIYNHERCYSNTLKILVMQQMYTLHIIDNLPNTLALS